MPLQYDGGVIVVFSPSLIIRSAMVPLHGRRPTVTEIDLDALGHNFRQVRQRVGAGRKILAVVKADAYGHGAVPVARYLLARGADLLGVALVEEAVALRREGIHRPILALGRIYPGQESQVLRGQIAFTLFDLESARRMNRAAREAGCVAPYHLKVDTGMGRVGFLPADLSDVLRELAGLDSLRMVGVLSHFAVADEPKNPFTPEQVDRFREAVALVRRSGFAPEHIHISNSAAVFSCDIPEINMVRPGIVLYGGLPSASFAGSIDLRPVMSLRSRVAQIKTVPPGTGVSYGHRFVTRRTSVLATIPVGYADGYNRLLTNRGEVLIRGRRAPVAGTVCMDWILVDVTDVPDVAVGDEVVLLGCDREERISAEEWAEKVGSINYEVFCNISKRVPRTYKESGNRYRESGFQPES